MTEEQQDQPKSYFPAPPQFFQQFTESNTSALEDARRSSVPGTPRVLELPPELRYLIPPAEPTDGKWRNYGDLYELQPALPSLEDQGIERLYPEANTSSTPSLFQNLPSHLNHIARSIIANYLELLGILAVDPAQAAPKVKALRDLFINGEHLINLYRPHQARESLILMMEAQLESKKVVIERVKNAKFKVEMALGQTTSEGLDAMTQTSNRDGDIQPQSQLGGQVLKSQVEEQKRQKNLWAALSEMED